MSYMDPYLDVSMLNEFTMEVDNSTSSCPRPTYIPTVAEYGQALGGYGVAFTTIGCVVSVLFYALFLWQVYFTYSYAHKVYRRHIFWLISIYPMVTLMSTLALIVPRAHEICSAVKITYMCIGVGHFVDLTILMFGCENKLVEQVKDRTLQFNLMPLCCCMPCLPSPKASKMRLRVVKWMIWQMKFTQAIYYFCLIFARLCQEDSDGVVQSRTVSYVLTVLNFVSFLSGVYALNIISKLVDADFSQYRYRAKALVLKILIITTKLQSFVFNVLGIFKAFPCLNEFITPVVYENTVENWILILEMLLFGSFSYFLYSKKEFLNSPINNSAMPVENGYEPPASLAEDHKVSPAVLNDEQMTVPNTFTFEQNTVAVSL